ncbi:MULTISPECIES: hypothetical protein [unclassified Treponema]|uniref:hypothetical protein n=1 Tax=unclassified Treponema TaxID=2638727 RepID=UPI0020A42B9D|nr:MULTISPECIES: hypothetical protein [unclassified Treponema]UTC68066.1 hypothetical protein E4O06_05340 [Treponema sp. OMZ 789]UTC70788.1 hypothetical protein E4O01_05485 [Treponema sp. OMZ 790]UTC73528.1 hypothetical protein E4O02_05680 [Treponema sp. OMZ 791]
MKKIIILIMLVVLCLTCTGCIDIVQHITRLPDGSEQNTIRITVSKMIFALVAGSSFNEDKNYEEFFNDKEIKELIDIPELSPFSAKISKINDPIDIGYLIDMNINYNDKNILKKINSQDSIDFIPKYTGEKAIINLTAFSEKSNEKPNNDEAAMALLASGKYRLLISKSCIKNISKVVLKNDKEELDYTFLDLYDQFLIEIPIPILFSEKVVLEIYF